jgi:hypothetical protein
MKKLVRKTVQIERTPLQGQGGIFYWEEVEEQPENKDEEGSSPQQIN